MKRIKIEKLDEYLVDLVRKLSNPHLNILKLDTFNECYKTPTISEIKGKVTCLELIPSRCKRARQMFPKATILQGSACKIPSKDKAFDLIFDFSTIDHIPDYENALKEYSRVMKDNGMLYVVTWLDVFRFKGMSIPRNAISKREFIKKLKKYFNVIHTRTLFRRKYRKNISFVEFKCLKNVGENIDVKD